MKALHSLLAGLRPASLILARRIALPLLLLTAGMMGVQPSPGQSGTWEETGSLAIARERHTATLLPNGKVLVAGGSHYPDYFSSAELYDPASGIWTATGSLVTARDGHTATLLPNGKVLVAGGSVNGVPLGQAELYDPASATWTATGSLATARYNHTATLLLNGKVLVAAGYNGSDLASAELYDPASGTWMATGSLATRRLYHTATLLPNGKVLIAAGLELGLGGGDEIASAELYDLESGTWTATGSLATKRELHTARLLPNGKVLIAGGYDRPSGNIASAEIYDPASGTWSATGSLVTARRYNPATLLPNGKVLVTGGFGGGRYFRSAELYDPASGTWTATGSLATARYNHTATLLPNGKVLVAAGYNGAFLASAELYTSGGGDIVLQARVKAQGNKHQVQLQWSPADGGDMNILRNGAVVATTPDDGQVPSNLGTHTGTFTYQVCETDSGDCSNEVTVVVP